GGRIGGVARSIDALCRDIIAIDVEDNRPGGDVRVGRGVHKGGEGNRVAERGRASRGGKLGRRADRIDLLIDRPGAGGVAAGGTGEGRLDGVGPDGEGGGGDAELAVQIEEATAQGGPGRGIDDADRANDGPQGAGGFGSDRDGEGHRVTENGGI